MSHPSWRHLTVNMEPLAVDMEPLAAIMEPLAVDIEPLAVNMEPPAVSHPAVRTYNGYPIWLSGCLVIWLFGYLCLLC